MTYGAAAGSPPWLSLWESQVPRVMHYTERCIEVRPCYLFDKLEIVALLTYYWFAIFIK